MSTHKQTFDRDPMGVAMLAAGASPLAFAGGNVLLLDLTPASRPQAFLLAAALTFGLLLSAAILTSLSMVTGGDGE